MVGYQQSVTVQAGTVEPKAQQCAQSAADQGEQGKLIDFRFDFHGNTFLFQQGDDLTHCGEDRLMQQVDQQRLPSAETEETQNGALLVHPRQQ